MIARVNMAVVGGADDAGNPPERINGLHYHICHFSFYQFMVIIYFQPGSEVKDFRV
jgi:hypothetical protein